MGGPKPVEKMEERDTALQGRRLGDQGHVVSFLNGAGSQHCESCGPAGHDVRVIAVYGKGVGCDRPCRDVHHKGGEFTGDLVHVRYHQEKPLRCRKRGGQRPRLESAVDRSGGPCL